MSKSQGAIDGGAHARKVEMGSDRSFGIVFTVVFVVVALLPLKDGGEPRPWAGAVAALFLLVALAYPRALKPLNRLWFLVGTAMHHVVTPLVMGLLFFATVTPIALIMRAVGKDPLRLRRDDAAASYWILRDPPGPDAESMRRQF